jgi:teichuronic acid biosynthesis glycosyltransferase TuaG
MTKEPVFSTFQKGLCSVIIPVHNGECYLEHALRSVLNQSYNKLEIIIINDASEDRTMQIAGNFLQGNENIKIITLQQNRGVAFARNTGLQNASGNYIAFLDSDDLWMPEKLAMQIRAMEEYNCDLCYTAYDMIDESGGFIKRRPVRDKVGFTDLLKENNIIFSGVLCKAEAIKNTKFNLDCFHEDYLFLLQLLQNGKKFYGLNEILIQYRVHGSGKSFDKKNAAQQRWNIYRNFLKMGFWESLYYFAFYTINGVLKYI